MIEAIIGWAWPYLLAGFAVLAGVWHSYSSGKKAGRNEKEVEHAKQRAKDLDRIKRSSNAQPVGSLSDDPNNRDNK